MNKIKINCLFLAYRNFDIIKMSLGSIIDEIARVQDRFEISLHVIENRSEYTDITIKDYLLSLVERGLVDSYLCLDSNITNNYIHLVFNSGYLDRWPSDYYIFTDGDIYVPKGTVAEQFHILETCPEVIFCGLAVDYSAWALPNKVNSGKALSNLRIERLSVDKCYIPLPTGFWFLMVKTKDWSAVYDFFESNGLRIVDNILKIYCKKVLRREWVQTKESVGRELHREYVDLNYDAAALKKTVINGLRDGGYASLDYDEPLYNHNKTSEGVLYAKRFCNKFENPSLCNVNPARSRTYKYDPYSKTSKLNDILSKYDTGHLVRGIPKSIESKLYIISRGLGTSFYIKSVGAMFFQMRSESTSPHNGVIEIPHHLVGLKNLYIDNFFNDISVPDNVFDNLLLASYNILDSGGHVRIFLFEPLIAKYAEDLELRSALTALKLNHPLNSDVVLMRDLLNQKLSISDKYTVLYVMNLFCKANLFPVYEIDNLRNRSAYDGTVYKLNARLNPFFSSLKIIKPKF